MERKDQLRNVAFGGAWSEQIAGREALAAAIDTLDGAASCADMDDPRDRSSVIEALELATADHPKGPLLRDAWARASGRAEPSVRVAELMTIVQRIRVAQSGSLSGGSKKAIKQENTDRRPQHEQIP